MVLALRIEANDCHACIRETLTPWLQDDMPFSTRAASRHGGGDGESLLEWMPYDMPFTPSSGDASGLLESPG